MSLLWHSEGSCLVCIWDREIKKDAPPPDIDSLGRPEEMGSFVLGSSGPKALGGTSGVRKRENFDLLSW